MDKRKYANHVLNLSNRFSFNVVILCIRIPIQLGWQQMAQGYLYIHIKQVIHILQQLRLYWILQILTNFTYVGFVMK